MTHPWEVLPALVDADILTRDEAKGIVLAHENVHRRAMMELNALMPELLAREEITAPGAQRVRQVIQRACANGMPDL